MALLGKLAVAVVGDINQLKTSFREVKRESQSLGREVQKSGLGLQQIAKYGTMAGAAIVSAMGAMTIATTKSAEEIDLLSKRTGVSREELQGLAYAAQQEGTDIQSLGTALARLSQNMYDASQGTGEARKAFKDFGIVVTDGQGRLRSSADVLMDLADRMRGMTNETEMSALAMKVLGRGAQDLVPFLRMGRAEIERLIEEARRLGYVIGEEATKQLEALGDELDAIKIGFAGFGRQISADLVPVNLAFARGLKEILMWIHAIPAPIRKLVTVGSLLAGTIALIGGALSLLVVKAAAARAALLALGTSFGPFLIGGAVVVGIGAAVSLIGEIAQRVKVIKGDLDDMSRNTLEAELIKWEARLKKAREELRKTEKMVGQKYDPKKNTDMLGPLYIGGILDEIEVANKAVANLKKRLKELGEEEPAAGTEKWSLTETLAKAKKELADIDKIADAFGDKSQVAADKIAVLKRVIVDLIEHGYDPTKTSLGNLIAMYQAYAEASQAATDAKEREKKATDLLTQAQQALNGETYQDISALETLRAQLEAQAAVDTERADSLRAAAAALNVLILSLRQATQDEQNAAEATELLAQGQAKLAEMTGQAIPEWETFAQKLEEAAAESGVLPETAEALRDLAAAIREAGLATVEIEPYDFETAFIAGLRDTAKEWKDFLDHVRGGAADLAQTMNQTLNDFFFDGVTAQLKNLGDYAQQVFNSIARSFANMLSDMLMNWLMSGFTNIFGGGFFGGGPVGMPWPSYIGTMAEGGTVAARAAYLVGERGPELFVPQQSGTIIPNDEIGSLSPKVTVNLINQSGTPLQVTDRRTEVDGEQVVATLWLGAYSKNKGGLQDVLGGGR
ncbi:MAG: phage tail tape measure protein [Patescibacteria group bacterium]